MKKRENLKWKFIALCFAAAAALLGGASASPVFAGEGKTFVIETRHRLNPDEGEFVFKLETYRDEYEMFFTKTIEISDAKTGKTIQTIATAESNDGEDASSPAPPEIIIEDMNFDGYDDMRTQAFLGAGPNIPYICWLWEKDKNQFVHDEKLSEIPSLEIDAENKWIKTSLRDGAAVYEELFYKYADGELTLFKSIREEYSEDGKTKEVTTMELKNGELEETGRKTVKAGEAE